MRSKRIPAQCATVQQGVVSFTPTLFPLLSKSYKLAFLPDKAQGFLTDWSQFGKGRDISNFADLGLGGCCELWPASSQLGGACVRARVRGCASGRVRLSV